MAFVDLSQPSVGLIPVLWVTWGSSGDLRFARSRQPLTIDGDLYAPLPEMEVTFPMLTGGIDSGTATKPVKIVVPDDIEPFASMVVENHAEVTVRVFEADTNDLDATPLLRWVGLVQRTRAHYKGQTRLMELSITGRKALLQDISLGIKASNRCPWQFGDDATCGATVAERDATVRADGVDGTTLRFSDLPADSKKDAWPPGRYTRGYVMYDELRIMIRKHVLDENGDGVKKVVLARAAPQSWNGQVIKIYEGCDKTVAACTAHDRTESFLGIGLRMPKHNPIIENNG
jgi:hypothetical protein